LWHIPRDLKFFKETTTGNTIVMGRKTFESIGRPLPNRKNIVITRNPAWMVPGVTTYNNLSHALEQEAREGEVFIIGGGEIYKEAITYAAKLYVTHVEEAFSGDTKFPDIDPTTWKVLSEKRFAAGDDTPHDIVFRVYGRR
jgi:dihydrofolate reductase